MVPKVRQTSPRLFYDLIVVFLERSDELFLKACENVVEHGAFRGAFEALAVGTMGMNSLRIAPARQKLEEHDSLVRAEVDFCTVMMRM
jgi:hypothetical protein